MSEALSLLFTQDAGSCNSKAPRKDAPKIISKRKKPNGSTILVSHYINKDYYGGYMFTLSINHESKEYSYSASMMGAGEILEGPVGSRGNCNKF